MFPSPIGELHFSINQKFIKKIGGPFPSPIGELHFSIGIAKKPIVDATATVSVPYRGATFLNNEKEMRRL